MRAPLVGHDEPRWRSSADILFGLDRPAASAAILSARAFGGSARRRDAASSLEDATASTEMSSFDRASSAPTRLRPSRGADESPPPELRIGGDRTSQSVLSALFRGARLLHRADRDGALDRRRRLPRGAADLPLSLWVRLRLALLFKKKKYLDSRRFRCSASASSPSGSVSPPSPSTCSTRGRARRPSGHEPSRASAGWALIDVPGPRRRQPPARRPPPRLSRMSITRTSGPISPSCSNV